MNWAEKLAESIHQHPFIILIVTLVFLITLFSTLSETIHKINNFCIQTFRWRHLEEEKINSLSASINIDNFVNTLGTPLFLSNPFYLNEGYSEYTFKRRGYWVQAITDKSGSVMFYAVTVCDKGFHPAIYDPIVNKRVIIGKSTFQDMQDLTDYVDLYYHCFTCTANAYVMEGLYGGNPGKYQTSVWGINDTCEINDMDKCTENGKIDRNIARINTFGKTAPFMDLISTEFDYGINYTLFADKEPIQIGVDRIKARTYDIK